MWKIFGGFHGRFRGSRVSLHGRSGSCHDHRSCRIFHGSLNSHGRPRKVPKTAWVGRICGQLSQLPRKLPLLAWKLTLLPWKLSLVPRKQCFRGSCQSSRRSVNDSHGRGESFRGSTASGFPGVLHTSTSDRTKPCSITVYASSHFFSFRFFVATDDRCASGRGQGDWWTSGESYGGLTSFLYLMGGSKVPSGIRPG